MDLITANIIVYCAMAVSAAEGLQCPSCMHIVKEGEVDARYRTIVNQQLQAISTPECSKRLKGPQAEIKNEKCAHPEVQIAMCRYYSGSVDLKVVDYRFTVPLRVYKQGCYYADSASPLSVGCHDREYNNDDILTMEEYIERKTLTTVELTSVKGMLCVCRDSYCKDDTGDKTEGSVMSPAQDETVNSNFKCMLC